MAKTPRNKIDLDIECDAFGCRPKSKSLGKGGGFGSSGGRNTGPVRPAPRYKWDVEKTPVIKSAYTPQTEVDLDIEEIVAKNGGQTNTQLFRGSYQDAQKAGALSAAAKASNTFMPQNVPKFTEESRQSLLKGGADPRTISPTSVDGTKTISKAPITKIKEQAIRQQLGDDYGIAKDGQLRSRTKTRIDPKTGEETAVRKLMYDEGTVTDINLQTGRAKITDLTTGKTKYSQSPEITVEKKGSKKVPVMKESIVTEEGQADVPEAEVKKAQLKAAVESNKPGRFSKEGRKIAQRGRRRKRYAQGSR